MPSVVNNMSIGTCVGTISKAEGQLVFNSYSSDENSILAVPDCVAYVTNETHAELWVQLWYEADDSKWSQIAHLNPEGSCYIALDARYDSITIQVEASSSSPDDFVPLGGVTTSGELLVPAAQVTITNNGGELTSPVAIALSDYSESRYTVDIVNETGEDINVCVNDPNGKPYLLPKDGSNSCTLDMGTAVYQWVIGYEPAVETEARTSVWIPEDDPQIVVKRPYTLKGS